MKQVRYALVAALALTTANAMCADLSITGADGIIDMIAEYDRASQAAANDSTQRAAAQAILEQLKEINKQATAPGQARSYIPIFMQRMGFDADGIQAKEAALAQPSEEEKRAQAAIKIGSAWRSKRLKKLQAALAQAKATEQKASDDLDAAIIEKNTALAAAKTELDKLPASKPKNTTKEVWDAFQSIKQAVNSGTRISEEVLKVIDIQVQRMGEKNSAGQTLSVIETNIFGPLSRLATALTAYNQAETANEEADQKVNSLQQALAKAQATASKKESSRPERKEAAKGSTDSSATDTDTPAGTEKKDSGIGRTPSRAKGPGGRRKPSGIGRTSSEPK